MGVRQRTLDMETAHNHVRWRLRVASALANVAYIYMSILIAMLIVKATAQQPEVPPRLSHRSCGERQTIHLYDWPNGFGRRHSQAVIVGMADHSVAADGDLDALAAHSGDAAG